MRNRGVATYVPDGPGSSRPQKQGKGWARGAGSWFVRWPACRFGSARRAVDETDRLASCAGPNLAPCMFFFCCKTTECTCSIAMRLASACVTHAIALDGPSMIIKGEYRTSRTRSWLTLASDDVPSSMCTWDPKSPILYSSLKQVAPQNLPILCVKNVCEGKRRVTKPPPRNTPDPACQPRVLENLGRQVVIVINIREGMAMA